MKNEKITEFTALALKSSECGSLKNITFHSPERGEMLKAKAKLISVGGGAVLQIETFLTEGRVKQKNIKFSEISPYFEQLFDYYKKADLNDDGGSASVMISKKGTVTLIKKGNIGEGERKNGTSENNKVKKYLLDGNEKFLHALGVSDENGRVHDKMQSKFRQICRFAEYIADAEKKLSTAADGELYVCDLCCGKSYLSFAAYHVLTEVCGRSVIMDCVDLKKSVMDYCSDIAEKCGMKGMYFHAMNIADFEARRAPNLVISLHACDIATDIVLEFAVKNKAEIILATPCCHHQMYNEMNCPPLSFITDYSMLKQKLASAATDALRLLMLESEGYKTDATELIDPEDTPKNIMLRGVRRKNYNFEFENAKEKREKYRKAYEYMYGKSPENH